jgi:hypothetical protein
MSIPALRRRKIGNTKAISGVKQRFYSGQNEFLASRNFQFRFSWGLFHLLNGKTNRRLSNEANGNAVVQSRSVRLPAGSNKIHDFKGFGPQSVRHASRFSKLASERTRLLVLNSAFIAIAHALVFMRSKIAFPFLQLTCRPISGRDLSVKSVVSDPKIHSPVLGIRNNIARCNPVFA